MNLTIIAIALAALAAIVVLLAGILIFKGRKTPTQAPEPVSPVTIIRAPIAPKGAIPELSEEEQWKKQQDDLHTHMTGGPASNPGLAAHPITGETAIRNRTPEDPDPTSVPVARKAYASAAEEAEAILAEMRVPDLPPGSYTEPNTDGWLDKTPAEVSPAEASEPAPTYEPAPVPEQEPELPAPHARVQTLAWHNPQQPVVPEEEENEYDLPVLFDEEIEVETPEPTPEPAAPVFTISAADILREAKLSADPEHAASIAQTHPQYAQTGYLVAAALCGRDPLARKYLIKALEQEPSAPNADIDAIVQKLTLTVPLTPHHSHALIHVDEEGAIQALVGWRHLEDSTVEKLLQAHELNPTYLTHMLRFDLACEGELPTGSKHSTETVNLGHGHQNLQLPTDTYELLAINQPDTSGRRARIDGWAVIFSHARFLSSQPTERTERARACLKLVGEYQNTTGKLALHAGVQAVDGIRIDTASLNAAVARRISQFKN